MTTTADPSSSPSIPSSTSPASIPVRSRPKVTTTCAPAPKYTLDQTLDAAQGNAYEKMIADLALHLGVSEDSLRRLGIGYLPAVPFIDRESGETRWSYDGFWTFAERDADAKVVGLSLRSQKDDFKAMYRGSKRGLVFEINPDHQAGARAYDPGPQNWIRTMDAGALCPVCEKPDGCLLSIENPADPQAVICIREKSDRPLRFGFLHLLKPEADRRSVSALPASNGDDPVLVVEGPTDTAAGMDLGFVTVGRPSNLAGMEELKELVRGRRVLIIGENDKKSDGKWPGREGMLAAFHTLQHVCKEPRMLMPPPEVKDLRAWKNRHGLTRDELLKYAEKNAQTSCASEILDNPLPDTIAQAFLDQTCKLGTHPILRRWREEWYRFEANRYAKCPEESLYPPLQEWAKDKKVAVETEHGVKLKLLQVRLKDISENLIAKTLVRSYESPSWLDGVEGPNPADLIAFPNGLLDIPAYFAGRDDAFRAVTPTFFTLNCLEFNFDPKGSCPIWLRFLDSSLGDEPEKIALLQEWMGLSLTDDTSYQKILACIGPPRAGKGTIAFIIRCLVGVANSAGPTVKSLSGPFGLWNLVDKRIAVIPDARFGGSKDSGLLETLLAISGEDHLTIDRKNLPPLNDIRLKTRLVILTNEPPQLPDASNALANRFLPLEFNRSFLGKEDRTLKQKLLPELPGIILWALEGLRRLRQQGRFTMPAGAIEATKNLERMGSPVSAFADDFCVIAPAITKETEGFKLDTLFRAWCEWCERENRPPGLKETFGKNLHSARPQLIACRLNVGGDRPRGYRGIQLNAEGVRAVIEWDAKETRRKTGPVFNLHLSQDKEGNLRTSQSARSRRNQTAGVGANN